MGKAPAFQFYVRDWLADPQLRMASASTRGIWIDLLCYMWEAPVRGEISGTHEELRRLLNVDNDVYNLWITEAEKLQFCTVIIRDKNVIVQNRRMFRDANAKINHALAQDRYRERQKSDREVTPPSSSSSSTSKNINKNSQSEFFKTNIFEGLCKKCEGGQTWIYKTRSGRKKIQCDSCGNVNGKKGEHHGLESIEDRGTDQSEAGVQD